MQSIVIFGKRINSGYLFSAPGVLFFLLLAVYPAAYVFYLAFFSSGKGVAVEPAFAGLENFRAVLGSRDFSRVVIQSLLYACTVTLINLTVGLLLAVLLSGKTLNPHFIRAARSLILVPWALSPTVVAVMAKIVLHPQIGPVAQLLQKFGSGLVFNPLGSVRWSLLTIILTNSYMYMPFYFLTLLASIQSINDNLYEAATIDGATGVQQFFRITLPLLKNNLLTLMIFNFCATFTYVDLTWIMTQGGPLNATEVLATTAYRLAFNGYQFGAAAAIGAIMFVVAVAFAAVTLRFMEHDL